MVTYAIFSDGDRHGTSSSISSSLSSASSPSSLPLMLNDDDVNMSGTGSIDGLRLPAILFSPTHVQFSISRNPNDAIRCTHLSADLTHPDSVGSDYPEHSVFPGGWASSVVACPCLVPVASWWPMTVCTGPWSSASNLIWWSWNALVQNVHHLRHCYWFPFYYRRLKHRHQQQRHLIKTKGTIRIRRIKWLNKLH